MGLMKINLVGKVQDVRDTRECPSHPGAVDYRLDSAPDSWWCGWRLEPGVQFEVLD